MTASNRAARRPLSWWMAVATSSLPVPDSPRISTATSSGATRSIRRTSACRPGLRPIRPQNAGSGSGSIGDLARRVPSEVLTDRDRIGHAKAPGCQGRRDEVLEPGARTNSRARYVGDDEGPGKPAWNGLNERTNRSGLVSRRFRESLRNPAQRCEVQRPARDCARPGASWAGARDRTSPGPRAGRIPPALPQIRPAIGLRAVVALLRGGAAKLASSRCEGHRIRRDGDRSTVLCPRSGPF